VAKPLTVNVEFLKILHISDHQCLPFRTELGFTVPQQIATSSQNFQVFFKMTSETFALRERKKATFFSRRPSTRSDSPKPQNRLPLQLPTREYGIAHPLKDFRNSKI
jgi:hypothetical protein